MNGEIILLLQIFQRGRGQLMAWQIQEEVDLEEVSAVPVQV